MSVLMDMWNGAQESRSDANFVNGDGLLGSGARNYGQIVDGIELPSLDAGSPVVIEEESNSPQYVLGRSRKRLMVVAGSIMLAVMLLMASSSGGGDNKDNKSPLPKYMSGSQTLTSATNAVAGKPNFNKPPNNSTKTAPPTFLPKYTMESLIKNPYSPQAKALKWVELYPHFSVIRRWRKRQLMALATFFYSTGGNLHWQPDAQKDWLSTKLHECNWQGDVMFNPECSKRGLKGRYTKLEIGMNNLQGTLPAELSLLSALSKMELYGNERLVGSIPSNFGVMTVLRDMSLYNNNLNGKFPSQLGRLTRLSVLNLDHNQFTGTLPSEIGLMKSIKRLHLSDNQFSGTVPSVLKQLSNLQSLYLHDNPKLNGTVSPSICYFADLEEIWVDCKYVKCPCQQCMCAEDKPIQAIPSTTHEEEEKVEKELDLEKAQEEVQDLEEEENEENEKNEENKENEKGQYTSAHPEDKEQQQQQAPPQQPHLVGATETASMVKQPPASEPGLGPATQEMEEPKKSHDPFHR